VKRKSGAEGVFMRQNRSVQLDKISIQTAGLAFGGTGLCSYRVRGVDGSHAKHLTVESYTVVMLLTFILIIIIIPSPLTPSFQASNLTFLQIRPTAAFPFFFRTDYMYSRRLLLLLLSISVFYFLVFFQFYTF